VLKAQDIKESDKLVTVFTEDFGKMNILVKGANRAKSAMLPLTLQFCFCDLVLFKGKSMYTINEGNVIESFQNFLEDIDSLAYGSYLIELIDISLSEGEVNQYIFRELITCYYIMKNRASSMEAIVVYFQCKLLYYTGHGITLDRCSVCKSKIISSNYFNFQTIGGICNSCEKKNGISVSYEAYSLLKYIMKIKLEDIARINLSNDTFKEIQKILLYLISENYSRKPKSLEILNLF